MITASIAHSSPNYRSAILLKGHPSQKYNFAIKDKKTAHLKAESSDIIKKNKYHNREDLHKKDLPTIKQITKTAVDTVMPTPKMQREQAEIIRNHHPFSQIQTHIKNHSPSSTLPYTTGIK